MLLIGAPVLPGGREHIVKKVQTKQAAIPEHVIYFNSVNSAATCLPMCQNGGTCIAPDSCNCTAGWSGSNCQLGR